MEEGNRKPPPPKGGPQHVPTVWGENQSWLIYENDYSIDTDALKVSPQFVFTGATQLSQPTETLALLTALWALLRWEERPQAGWLLLGGAALGFAVLVRPLPGVLFVATLGAYLLVPAQSYVARFLGTFQEFPPRQKAASFSLDEVMDKLNPTAH